MRTSHAKFKKANEQDTFCVRSIYKAGRGNKNIKLLWNKKLYLDTRIFGAITSIATSNKHILIIALT